MQTDARRKPEVIKTVAESFRLLADSFLPALSAGGLPILLALMVMLVGFFLGTGAVAAISFIVFLLILVPSFVAVFVVAQATAIGVEVPTAPGALFMKSQFWKCVGASLIAGLAGAAVLAVTSLPALFVWLSGSSVEIVGLTFLAGVIVGIPVATYVGVRLNLLVPSIVAGQPFSVSSAWKLANGNVFGIFLATLLCSLPVSIAHSIVESVSKDSDAVLTLVIAGILSLGLAFVQCLLTGAVCGIFYRELSTRA